MTSVRSTCRGGRRVLVATLQGKPILQSRELVYQGFVIRKNTEGLVNLTDMWRASGSSPNKQPALWWRLESTQELVNICGSNLRQAQVWTTFFGNTGSTWVIPNLANAYAKHPAPRFP